MHSDDSFNLFVEAVLNTKQHSHEALQKAGVTDIVILDADSNSNGEDKESAKERKKRKKKEKKKKRKTKERASIAALMEGRGTDLARQKQIDGIKKKRR